MADSTSDQSAKVHRTMIRLWSADKVEFQVDREVACEFQALRYMITGRSYEDPPIHMHRISSRLLGKILKYCEYHVSSRRRREASETAAEVFLDAEKAWDTEYIKVDRSTLFDLLEVSSEWHIDGLVSLSLSEIVQQIYDGAKKLIAEEEAHSSESKLGEK